MNHEELFQRMVVAIDNDQLEMALVISKQLVVNLHERVRTLEREVNQLRRDVRGKTGRDQVQKMIHGPGGGDA